MGDIWCYLALICPYFVEGTGWNRLDVSCGQKDFVTFCRENS